MAQVFHGELWGTRKRKYEALWDGKLKSFEWTPLEIKAPRFPFVVVDWETHAKYISGFSLADFMPLHGNGVVTKRDQLCIQNSPEEVRRSLQDFIQLSEDEFREKYSLPADVRDWRYEWARSDVSENIEKGPIAKINYRPFSQKWIFYSGNTRGLVGWPVEQIMGHYLRGKNIGFLAPKSIRDMNFAHAFVTENISEAIFLSSTTASNAMNFPLYIYPDSDEFDQSRRINFDQILYEKLRRLAIHPERGEPDEMAVFDYIYGVLHCPAYRGIYAEFLKTDFPRIPYPTNPDAFWSLSEKGEQLRRLHLMEKSAIGDALYPFKGEGNNIIEKPRLEGGKVWVNKTQYFENVSEVAWLFPIGGYLPAQKWLKDKKGETLGYEDVVHYQKIIKILSETDRIMKTIEMEI